MSTEEIKAPQAQEEKTTAEKVQENIQEKTTAKPTFSPNKNYGWEPDDKIVFSGQEFGTVINLMLMRKQELLNELQAIQIMENKVKEMVEWGIAKEREPEQAPQPEAPKEA